MKDRDRSLNNETDPSTSGDNCCKVHYENYHGLCPPKQGTVRSFKEEEGLLTTNVRNARNKYT